MSLTPRHRHELIIGSGITEAIVATRGYETAETGERLAELGFSPEQCLAPALIIPIHGVDGGVVGYQAKPDTPRERDGKPIKYETPLGASMRLDICPVESISAKLKNPAEDLWITEGIKKGDSAASRGLCCIALMGVWNWRGKNDFGGITELADWEAVALKGRRVYIAFDSDVMVKPQVQAALRRLAAFLKRRGARDVVPIVPFKAGHDGKLGIDDFFVIGGTVDELRQCADTEILEERAIKANNRSLGDITDDALNAIIEANDPPSVFIRDGQLVQVRYDEKGVPSIVNMTSKSMRGTMARCAKWIKAGKDSSTEIAPPIDVVDDLMALGSWPGVPPISSVTLAPVLSPSGTIRREHGYDPESWFYVGSQVAWPAWEGTTESARDFLLDEVLHDFPFATEADRAGALALMLLPIVRPYIKGPTPMHLIDAPVQGSGKSLLAEVCLMATCGDNISVTPASGDDEEWRKRIVTSLLYGAPYVFFDNVKRMINAEALDAVLTSSQLRDRILGTNNLATVEIRCTWVMTSNNTDLSRDMVRRTCWIRIDPQVEQPEDRPEATFKHPNIKRWVSQNRPQIVAALCKLVEAWAECKDKAYTGRNLGSYEAWCTVIGGILSNAGVEGFLGNIEALKVQANSIDNAWKGFYMRWWEKFGGEHVKAGDLRDLFESDSDLAGLLGGGNESSRTTRLGYLIRKRVDRIAGGLKIARSDAKTGGSTCYVLVPGVGFDASIANPHSTPTRLFEPETEGESGGSGGSGGLSTRVYAPEHVRGHVYTEGGENSPNPHYPHYLNLSDELGLAEEPQTPTQTPTSGDDDDENGWVII